MVLDAVELKREEKQGISNLNSGSKLNPLEMEIIVEKILLHLDLKSLGAARGVNRLWNFEGNKIIFKNYFIRVPWALYSRENRQKKGYEKLKHQFKNFLSYNSFKIPHLSINSKSDAEVLKVIGEQGQGQLQEVRSLRWPRWSCNVKEPEKVLKDLLYQLPNLNYLETAIDIDFESVKVIMDFCLATKSEKQMEAQNSKFPLALVLSRFLISCDHIDNLSFIVDFEKFSKCEGVLIQNFEVGSFFILQLEPQLQNRVVKILTDFIWQSRKSLKELSVDECEKYISQIHFPEMPKLRKLDLLFNGRRQNPALNIAHAFPKSFKFSETTPNLKEFHLSWFRDLDADETDEVDSDFWSTVFESTGSAPSVQKLFFRDTSLIGHNIDKLLQIFPNLQDFEAWKIQNFESVLKSVCKFGKNIKRLSFQVDLNAQDVAGFDRIFTGFSQETVDKINKSKSKLEDGKFQSIGFDVENLRVNPSILDLKGLKSMKMTIGFWGNLYQDDVPEESLSVAGEFAFKLRPKTDFYFWFNCKAPNVVRAARKLSQLPNVNFAAC